jgi:O-antigen ligase
MEKPVVGWGVRANRYFGSTENIAKDTSEQKFTTIAPHPHNVAMEFWTDYGLIGILLLSFTLISFGNATSTLPAKKRSILAVISVACFSYSMTGAAFMQGWWIGSMAMVAIAFIAANRSHILVE